MDLNSDVLWIAFGLMLVFEGLMPFASPEGWRKKMMQILALHNGQIRFFGLALVLTGVLILWWLG